MTLDWCRNWAIVWVFLKDTILKQKFVLYFHSSSIDILYWSIALVLKIEHHTCTDIPLSSWAQALTWNQILQICIQALRLLFHQTSTDGKGFSRLTITFLCPFYLQSKLLISLSTGLLKAFKKRRHDICTKYFKITLLRKKRFWSAIQNSYSLNVKWYCVEVLPLCLKYRLGKVMITIT